LDEAGNLPFAKEGSEKPSRTIHASARMKVMQKRVEIIGESLEATMRR
jgi:hypothetical protein